jgi:hypothetical protein
MTADLTAVDLHIATMLERERHLRQACGRDRRA